MGSFYCKLCSLRNNSCFQMGFIKNVMILNSTLSIFHSFPATYHLGLLMVYTSRCSKDMHDAAHIMMISDITTSAWLIDFCHKTINPCGLRRSHLRKYLADIKISLRNARCRSNCPRFVSRIIFSIQITRFYLGLLLFMDCYFLWCIHFAAHKLCMMLCS